VAGGCLGVLFLIPLRRYFAREMHGQLPFPEATAITEVLVTGEQGGSQAKLLLQATAIAGVYDFIVTTFHAWKEYLDFQFVPVIRTLADKGRMVFSFDAIGFILGLGYVMGLRSSLVFCAGSVLTSFVLVPMIWFIGSHTNIAMYPAMIPVFSLLLGVVIGAICVAIFFGRLQVFWTVLALGLALTLLFSFFFTSVAANAIATTANNPASGMTMLTIIISAVALLNFGLSGDTGMFFVMAIAGMVCTALCVSGQFITDLKAGYWLGSTPAAQEKVKFIGVAAAAVTVGLTIILLAHVYQFGEAAPGDTRQILAAPQASIMKALVVGFMNNQPVAYILFGIGAMITIVVEMLGKSSMVFALGIYLPLGLTSPVLAGGMMSHLINKRSDKTGGELGGRIRERGVISASGLMAGGALGGVLGASLRLFPWYREDLIQTPFYLDNPVSQSVSILLFAGLCFYVWFYSVKKDKV
jgi:uncharacterized oligopeptide transporter (OPT) family protein